jgi:hypothetical protein
MEFWKGYNGQQPGDPAKLAQGLITLSSPDKPPRGFVAGADAVETAGKVAATLQRQAGRGGFINLVFLLLSN